MYTAIAAKIVEIIFIGVKKNFITILLLSVSVLIMNKIIKNSYKGIKMM